MEPKTMTQEGFIEGLCRQYQAQLNSYLAKLVGSWDIAQELSQDSFEHVYKNYRGDDVSFPRAMLFRVATNLAFMHLRRRRVERKILGEAVELDELKDHLPDTHAITAHSEILEEQIGQHIVAAIKELRLPYRRVFVMAHVQSKSRREISAALKVTEKRIDKRMTKALKRCRDRLEELGVNFSDVDSPVMLVSKVGTALGRSRR